MSSNGQRPSARFEQRGQEYFLVGEWTLTQVPVLEPCLRESFSDPGQAPIRFNASELVGFDTAGAWLLLSTFRDLRSAGLEVLLAKLRPEFRELLELVEERGDWQLPASTPLLSPLARLGKAAIDRLQAVAQFLSFTGAVAIAVARTFVKPTRLRVRALFSTLHNAGVSALPIVGLMAFLLGVVIAYQGGLQLKTYGANIFIVELVCLTMLRELAPLIAAIMVAGRTGSAFTAQIGTMRVTEEIDALNTIGIDPLEMLVVPKLVALVIVLPLLTVFADVLSVFGGMAVADLMLDVGYSEFVNRIPQAVSATSFLIGIGKAPVFAAIIALVGCYQGFQVQASAESVGRQTTASVVQAIFLVIVADAGFSVILGTVGL